MKTLIVGSVLALIYVSQTQQPQKTNVPPVAAPIKVLQQPQVFSWPSWAQQPVRIVQITLQPYKGWMISVPCRADGDPLLATWTYGIDPNVGTLNPTLIGMVGNTLQLVPGLSFATQAQATQWVTTNVPGAIITE